MAEAMLLSLSDLRVAYGGIQAVRGVDLAVREGERVCLIGANGAGKSTILRAICGLVPVAGGQVCYDGANVTGWPPHALACRRLVMVPEGRGIFGTLTIEENLRMGAYLRRDREAAQADLARVYATFPRLAERRRQSAGTLSGGEQQMLALGRAMLAQPRLLLLDEPSMGLAPMMIEKVFEVVRAIAEDGVTVLLIEQNARMALQLADRGYVLESGRIALSGPADSLLHDPRVRAAYLGEAA